MKRWVDEAEGSVDEEEGEEEAEGREEPDFTRDELSSSLWLFFFPMKSISLTRAYGTSFTEAGMTQ